MSTPKLSKREQKEQNELHTLRAEILSLAVKMDASMPFWIVSPSKEWERLHAKFRATVKAYRARCSEIGTRLSR